MNRQRLILFVLALVFVGVAIRGYYTAPRQKVAENTKQNSVIQRSNSSARRLPSSQVLPVRVTDPRILNIALLDAEQTSFKGYRRNIFKPVFIDEVKAMKQKASAVKPPIIIPPPIQKTVDDKKDLPLLKAEPPRELARFTFLGFLKKDNQKTIFLTKDKDIILVKQGDKIAGKYEAVSITEQALTILVLETGDEIVIPLIESKALVSTK